MNRPLHTTVPSCLTTVRLRRVLLYACAILLVSSHPASDPAEPLAGLRFLTNHRSGVVTFPDIGKRGRLGNQLFQIAATVGIAKRNRLEWVFPPTIEDCAAGKLLVLKTQRPLPKKGQVRVTERSQLYYDVALKPNDTHSIFAISGYFQSLRYFENSLSSLKPVLQISGQLIDKVAFAMQHVHLENSIGLHVRRGDYIKLNNLYGVLDENYYLSAISLARNHNLHNGRIIIVSDDVEWCKNYLMAKMGTLGKKIMFSPFSNDELLDFVLLYLTRHNIIANSSFSWWAAFLKRIHEPSIPRFVVAPRYRYNTTGRLAYLNANQIYPSDWILL